jgi:hypothetical protein
MSKDLIFNLPHSRRGLGVEVPMTRYPACSLRSKMFASSA